MATTATKNSRRTLPTPDEIPELTIAKIAWDDLLKLTKDEVTLAGKSLIITGANRTGKTSIITGILMVLGELTQKQIPEPIRQGREHAAFRLELADANTGKVLFIVERTWSAGKTKLTILAPDGHEYADADAMLKAFLAEVCLTPWAFLKMRPQDQLEEFLRVFGIKPPVAEVEEITGEDQPALPGESASKYLERLCADRTGVYYLRRTEANREWTKKQAAFQEALESLDATKLPDGISGEPLSELIAQKRALEQKREQSRALRADADKVAGALAERRRTLQQVGSDKAGAEGRAKDIESQIAEMQKRLEGERQKIAECTARLSKGEDVVKAIQADLDAAQEAVRLSPDPTPQILELDRQIDAHEQHGKAITAKQVQADQVDRLRGENEDAKAAFDHLELIVMRIRDLRDNMLNGVDLGLPTDDPELSIGKFTVVDGELRLNDRPFVQGSLREKIIAAACVNFRRNPKLKLACFDDAEHLDEIGESLLLRLAKHCRWQLVLAFVVRGQKQLKTEIVEAA